ncbi:PaaI family thioesterase [Phyllobacterium sp. 628]|uniref:PaaI family thioesterase n=1 Tax=Phyllobacterium sp. 628 TaxID=2718938 RepID=UPI001FCE4980|nr:PaaI family thioesterase [Phyllobacterium sp. 628]
MSDTFQPTYGLVPPEVAATLSGVEFMQGLLAGTYPAPPFAETTGLWPVSVEAGKIVFEAMPSKRFYNPMGAVHGGWISLLIDTVMGCAVHSSLKAGQAYTTIEMKTTFVRPVFESTGKLRCEGLLLHSGSRTASSEGKIFDGNGRLVAHGSETCLIMDVQKKTAA